MKCFCGISRCDQTDEDDEDLLETEVDTDVMPFKGIDTALKGEPFLAIEYASVSLHFLQPFHPLFYHSIEPPTGSHLLPTLPQARPCAACTPHTDRRRALRVQLSRAFAGPVVAPNKCP